VLYGIERFPVAGQGSTVPVVALERAVVAPGAGTVEVEVSLPPGYKLNDLAPLSLDWQVSGEVAELPEGPRISEVAPELPLEVEVVFGAGSGVLAADLTVYYCATGAEQLCLFDRVRLELPLAVDAGGAARATMRYAVPPLQG
jgi:hypothetical protein